MKEKLDVQTYPALMHKINRIYDLYNWGLNIPRMIFFQKGAVYNRKELIEFLKRSLHVKKFNIRTYGYDVETMQEEWSSKHYVGLSEQETIATVDKIIESKFCMIDAEVPDDGIYAGNLVIQKNDYCIIEYFHGSGAMVRMANESVNGSVVEVKKDLRKGKHESLIKVIDVILKLAKRDILFEWSVQRNPCGVLGEEIIWWEWRSWVSL